VIILSRPLYFHNRSVSFNLQQPPSFNLESMKAINRSRFNYSPAPLTTAAAAAAAAI
jgi:hypothetical protein